MKCEMIKKGERVLITIDEEPLVPFAYMTYNHKQENYKSFSEIDTPLYSFGVYAGDLGININSGIKPFRKGFYKGYGIYDFEEVKDDLETITLHNKDAYIIPRIYIDCPSWWEKLNPNELMADYRQEKLRQSYASDKWRHDMLKALCAFIDFINNSQWANNVIGYQIAAGSTEEWFYHKRFESQFCDYSECIQKRYREWLDEKYVEIETLNRRWNSKYTCFSEIDIPNPFDRKLSYNEVLRDPEKEMHIIDFYLYHNHLVADTILYFCKNIKEYTNSTKLTGAFYGYLCELVNQDLGHHALNELMDSEFIDFFASPNSYMDGRSPGIDWPYMSVSDSARLHGKMWFIESDIRTSLTQSLREAMPEVAPDNSRYSFTGVWKGPETTELSLSLIKKSFGRVLTGLTGTWWFDMWGGWFNDFEYMDFLKKSKQIMKEHIEENIQSKCEVAVFVDDKSYSFFALNHPVLHELVYKQRKVLGLMGCPYHLYLTDDIATDEFDADRYKLYIFLNSVVINPSTKKSINSKLKMKGKTLMWVYIEDMYDIEGNVVADSVTDFNITYDKEQMKPCLSGRDILESKILSSSPDVYIKLYDYTSIYCTNPSLTVELLSEVIYLSGVHVYCNTQDVIYADSKYIFIHAATAGEKRIYFPQVSVVYDALTKERLADSCTFLDIRMEQYETRIFMLEY